MFRIDSDGATVGNRFTEGDPGTAVPATVVSDEWLNNVQEEIIKPIEEMGLTLDKLQEGQLWEALLELALRGGIKTPLTQSLDNNAGPLDVTGFLMNKSVALCKVAFYYIERKTDTQSVQEAGILISRYNSRDDDWEQESMSLFNDSGVIFSIDDADTDAAQLQYTTDDLTGTTYSGQMRLTSIFEIRA